MARFRSLEPPKRWPDVFSASRSALESRGQSSRLPLAIVDGPVQQVHTQRTTCNSFLARARLCMEVKAGQELCL